MKKTLAAILTGISLAFGNLSKSEDLPTQIELKNNQYSVYEEVTLERRNMAGTKVIDRSQTQPIFLKGKYSPEGKVSISYSTHPLEERAIRPKQGFASSRIYVGIPEGTEISDITQKAETIGNFDKVTTTDLKPLEETRYAKTFLKMGNNGIEKLRGYDPLQKASDSLNESIFLLTGTDLNLGDKFSIYAGLKAFSDNIVKQERERGKSTFRGELELKEISLFPIDSIIQPTETKREINFRIKPGTYLGETIPFTIYQKLVLGKEATEGIGKLERFFSGEIENPNGQTETEKQQGIIDALSTLEGYWKYTENPGWLKSYIEIRPIDQKTIEIGFLEININEGKPKEEKSMILSYDKERKLLTLESKKGEKKAAIGFYGVKRLSDDEKEKDNKEIKEAVNFGQSIGIPWLMYTASDKTLLDESEKNFRPALYQKGIKWYEYRKAHPYALFDEDSKGQQKISDNN